MVSIHADHWSGNSQHGKRMTDGTCIVQVPVRTLGVKWWRTQGFKFCLGTWEYLSDYTQLALNEFDVLGENFIPKLYYAAAWAYNWSEGNKFPYTEKDVRWWIAEMPQREAQKILDTMLRSRIGGESMISLMQKSIDDEKKKSGTVKSGTMP